MAPEDVPAKNNLAKWLKLLLRSQRGQALPAVLGLLVLGGLMVVPSLNYAATSLKGNLIISEMVKGTYAADAGVEYNIWALSHGYSPATQLAESVNGMSVSLLTQEIGTYTVYLGELVETNEHYNWLGIEGAATWDEAAQAYRTTVTVTWQPETGQSKIHLTAVGVRLPVNYHYQAGSAAGFPGNLSLAEPDITTDSTGAELLNWEFDTPLPYVSQSNPTATQTCYITGTGQISGDLTWVVAAREDIGAVGEVTGTLYRITATANKASKTTAKVIADVLITEGIPYVISWQITK